MARALGILLVGSAALFAALTVWTNHTTAATHATSHAFAQHAKSICDRAPHTASGLEEASAELGSLHQPPNIHRAVARLQFHWARLVRMLRAGAKTSSQGYRAEVHQAFLSAHLLNISACQSIAPH